MLFISGNLFIHHYSPISFYLYLPCALLIIGYTLRKNIGQTTLWLILFGLYFILLYFEDFHHYETIEIFPFEVLVLGFYNLIRSYHVFYEIYFHKKQFSLDELIGFLWYPPILFSGPLERIEEWVKYHKTNSKIDWKRGGKLILRSLLFASIAEVFYTQFTPSTMNFQKASYFSILLYAYSIGLIIHFRLASYIDFARFFSILMGYPFKRPNFNSPYSSKSIASFWSRWNMSVARFANDYILIGGIPKLDKKKFAFTIVINFIIVGLCHGLDLSFILWGGIHGLAIIINFIYIFLKYKTPKLLLWDQKYFYPQVKTIFTLSFLHLTAILLDVRAFEIFEALCKPIKLWVIF
ncbi:hypothetical protein MJH12_03820 [bacterium]|nr:hypothetical protein [bacterium]